jgi:hypothetical protein
VVGRDYDYNKTDIEQAAAASREVLQNSGKKAAAAKGKGKK